jgi:hypothetical protein
MPLDTNLNQAPWFDDFDPKNEFYGVAFKPVASIQARELNQMQSILRHQIEKFGDAIFEIGTIIDGCNFNFYPSYPYVKIKDLTTDNLNVTPDVYKGFFVKNNANLQAIIVDSAQGFETTAPDLNTLYISYRNSGTDGNTFAFGLGDVLTIFDSNTSVYSVKINNAGQGFSNTDTAVFTSALVVNVSSGSFSNGDYVTQPTTGANLQIISVDTTTRATFGQVVLFLKPRVADLTNPAANSMLWQVANNDTIHNLSNTVVGSVEAVVGAGAKAGVVTDGSGRIMDIAMVSRGYGYDYVPTVTVMSPNNVSGATSLSLTGQNWVTKVTIANTVGSVGNGYAFGVSEGTIYQKGLFLKVDAQTIVIEKYSQVPNNVSVGFRSIERIINADIDPSLLDNAAGYPNEQAPGADRIKITPTLALMDADVTDNAFLAIVSWSEGNPYKQNQSTQFSTLGDEMARRGAETNGDFILSRFQVTSRSPFTRAYEANTVSIVVNPGSAYIKGRRVFNETNYVIDIPKAIDSRPSAGRYISLNYGNWIRVKEVGGLFQFNTGDLVYLYDAPKAFISNTTNSTTGNTTPVGNVIGTARVRSMTHESGVQGDATAAYRLYLFEINMSAGANFSLVRSIAYTTGAFPGIADVVLTLDATTNSNIAKLANTDYDYLLFSTGNQTLKNATNVNYTYRTIDQSVNMSNTGILTKSIASSPGETFEAIGTLTTAQLSDMFLTPLSNNLIASANAAGTANALNSNTFITGNATTWANDFAPGDFIQLYQNTTVSSVRRVAQVVNNTFIVLDSNPSFTGSNLATYRYFPKFAPIALGSRLGYSANVSANGNLLSVNLGTALQGSSLVTCALAVNIKRTNATPASKTAARNQMVRISIANNTGGSTGPWCLGVSDVFRLKRVFLGTSNTVNSSSTDVTSYFYIDHKQNEDYVDLAYLYPRPQSGLTLNSSAWLLCQFDAFQTSGSGYFNTVSYTGANSTIIQTTDSTPLANLGSSVSTWEVPELFSSRGKYFDLLQYFDFRPIVANTVVATTNAATAPINPTYSLSFGNTANPANDKKFPVPDSLLQFDIEQYMARIDSVFATKDGGVYITRGIPYVNPDQAKTPQNRKDGIRLVNINLPSYPNMTQNPSAMQAEILTTRIGNANYLAQRQSKKTITIPSAPGTSSDTQPRGYTMSDIGALDRRISNLEYVGALNALQSDMATRVVPSSVDGTLNRFKFGFFVDDFSSGVSQDVTNPSYSADVSGGCLTPPTVTWAVGYGEERGLSVPYIDFPIISQPDGTLPLVLTTIETSANVWMLRTDHLAPSQSGQVVLTDYAYPVMSNTAGPVTLYFHIPQTTTTFTTGLILDPDNFFIYQGNQLLYNAYDHAVPLTDADKTFLKSPAVPGLFFNSTVFTPLDRPAVGWVNGSGKITFNHNPSGGKNYTIRSERQSRFDHWIWGLQYPSSFGSVLASPSITSPSYSGLMDVEPPTMLLALQTPTITSGLFYSLYIGSGNGGHLLSGFQNPDTLMDYTSIGNALSSVYDINADTSNGGTAVNGRSNMQYSTTFIPQSFGITVYGLRPLTVHNVTINGIDKGARCATAGGGLGGQLMSDYFGVLRFNYFYDGNSADQDIRSQLIGPLSDQVSWATEQAASVVQPIATGALTVTVSAPNSTATYMLTVVADPELVLQTVGLNRRYAYGSFDGTLV